MDFNSVTASAQDFSENTGIFGEAFTYTAPGGGAATSFVGVFNQVEIEYNFGEFSNQKVTGLMCVTSKPKWTTAGVTPANRGVITYGGIGYVIEKIDGLNTAAEPAYGFTLKRLT